MGKLKNNLVDRRFGKLLVIDRAPNRPNHHAVMWNCVCDCGTRKVIQGSSLISGDSTSCGCNRLEVTHGMYGTPTYIVWANMLQRCNNPKNPSYVHYGAAGIFVEDERWKLFENFFHDMGERPEGLTLDRIDPSKGYFKENCRWADKSEQAFNTKFKPNNSSGVPGVTWIQDKYWFVTISKDNKTETKTFKDLEEAIEYRKQREIDLYGYLKYSVLDENENEDFTND